MSTRQQEKMERSGTGMDDMVQVYPLVKNNNSGVELVN